MANKVSVKTIVNDLLCRTDGEFDSTLLMTNGACFASGMVFQHGEGWVKALAIVVLAFVVLYNKDEEDTAAADAGSGSGDSSSSSADADDEEPIIDINKLIAKGIFFTAGLVLAKKTGFGKSAIDTLNNFRV